MFNVLLRAVLLFIAVLIVIRLMGKRQVGQLQPSEFVVTLMAANLATVPMSDVSVPLLWGIIGLGALLFMQVAISLISLKSVKARRFLSGEPEVLICRGKIMQQALQRQRYNVNDLIEQLRNNNIFDISEVQWALLETNGQLSILRKDACKPPQKSDFNLPQSAESELSMLLISGGKLLEDNLKITGKNVQWLNKQLNNAGITDIKQVLVAQYETGGKLFIQRKDEA